MYKYPPSTYRNRIRVCYDCNGSPGVLEVGSTVKHSFTAESAKVVQFFNSSVEQFPTRILS